MKTEIQKKLAAIAPNITVETLWSYDHDLYDIRDECDGFDDENPDDWQAWQSEIRATVIQDGEEEVGSAYLGGTWEKAGDEPSKTNPTISGYEPQMIGEALLELPEETPNRLESLEFLKKFMHETYEAQQKL